MHPRLIAALAAMVFLLAGPPSLASAEPTPPPSPAPAPSDPSASPVASPPGSATPAPSASPEGDGLVTDDLERAAGARADLMRRVFAATSLLDRIEAQRRLATAERDFLHVRIAQIESELELHGQEASALRSRLDEKRRAMERLIEQTYRASRTSPLEVLLLRGSIVDVVVHIDGLEALSDQERIALRELRQLEAELERRRIDMERQQAELRDLADAVAAKDEALAALEERAERLASAAKQGARAASDAEIALLRELAEENARESRATAELIAEIARREGVDLPSADEWTWPLDGYVTQEFGPSSLVLEPPVTYNGVEYPHFHNGLDVAAPLGTAVRAAARGRVEFVGHIAGGTMVVVIAHDDGHVTLYGHLDDTTAPPPVREGDIVEAGEPIGAVGLTGVTTGPHLHFVVSLAGEPIDPRVVLPIAP